MFETIDMTTQELYKAVENEVRLGYVRKYNHPVHKKLWGYDYTAKCQMEKRWNGITNICRGLVFEVIQTIVGTDAEGQEIYSTHVNLYNNPLPKAPNVEETEIDLTDNSDTNSIVSQVESVTSKEDGSCIIAFMYNGKEIFMTRGSFCSKQAMLAEQIFFKYYLEDSPYKKGTTGFKFLSGTTYIFELVGPSNKNVNRTKYLEDDLIFITSRQETKYIYKSSLANRESAPAYRDWLFKCSNLNFVVDQKPLYLADPKSFIKNVKENTDPNFEGVVFKFKDGNRVKEKSKLYCQLHKVLTGAFTTKRLMDIWYTKKISEDKDYLEDIPDEFFTELDNKLNQIDTEWIEFFSDSLDAVRDLKELNLTRKEIAQELIKQKRLFLINLVCNKDNQVDFKYLYDVFYKLKVNDKAGIQFND